MTSAVNQPLVLLAGPVEAPLRRSIWICDVSARELVIHVMELIENTVLVKAEFNMAIVEQNIDTRIFPIWKAVIALIMS